MLSGCWTNRRYGPILLKTNNAQGDNPSPAAQPGKQPPCPQEQSFAAFTEDLEIKQMHELGDRLVTKSLLYHLADGDRALVSVSAMAANA